MNCSEETGSSEQSVLVSVMRGNRAAVDLVSLLAWASQVMDDLIDKDKPVSDEALFKLFWTLTIELPANQFYRQHEAELQPLLAVAIQDWKDATTLERTGDAEDRHLSFVLRNQLIALAIRCAGLIGGYQWQQEVSIPLRRFFYDETFQQYLDDLEASPCALAVQTK